MSNKPKEAKKNLGILQGAFDPFYSLSDYTICPTSVERETMLERVDGAVEVICYVGWRDNRRRK